MLPFWMQLSAQDLIQGTAILSMAVIYLMLRLMAPVGRA